MLRQKWHTSHRNLKIGDVVLIQDSNLVRGNWKLGKVSNVYPGAGSLNIKKKTGEAQKAETVLPAVSYIYIYYPTALSREQITPKTSKNIARYLYSRGPV